MKRRTIKRWSRSDQKTLKKMAGRQHAARIAKELRRTEGAVRQFAGSRGISLAI